MSKMKKNIMSRTESLLAEVAEKLGKLIEIESHISSLLEQDVTLERLQAEQAGIAAPNIKLAKVKEET